VIKWLLLIPLLLVVFIAGISFYLQPNDYIGCSDTPIQGADKCGPVDAIVVVSGGDTNERTDEGITLFKQGWADTIIFSGAAKDKTGLSNATAMKLRAMHAGIPENSIYIDELAETTAQNAANSQSIFQVHGFETVMLVTSGYHQRRASLEFEKRAGDTEILSHPVLEDKDWSFAWWWTTPRGWWLAGGELAKVVAFYVSGETTP
jgi:uncharacterized SAM-binding protein YcdF (DUF218 family)